MHTYQSEAKEMVSKDVIYHCNAKKKGYFTYQKGPETPYAHATFED